MIRALFFHTVLVNSTFLLGISAILAALLTREPKYAHLIARLWGRVNLWAAGVKVRVKGLANLESGRPYIFLSNHQSAFDILALLGKLPVQFAWLAKEELFSIPVMGRAMSAAGYIPIDRSNRRKAMESLNETAERIRKGTSVVIFPEGTRSPDGVLQPFKKGAFIIAAKAQQQIVPIAISGSYRIVSRQCAGMVHPGVVDVMIETPISTVGLTAKDNETLMRTVRESICRHLTPEEGGLFPVDTNDSCLPVSNCRR